MEPVGGHKTSVIEEDMSGSLAGSQDLIIKAHIALNKLLTIGLDEFYERHDPFYCETRLGRRGLRRLCRPSRRKGTELMTSR
ncbi:hypothetical protein EVAR_100286_1 [Eumeta japonica]|uniref:Uncharacterized protein n=1 Tax=Eumeta variegata TaxID=151549 RepID=A0A4C2A8V3_EUMVA|nr:hypothetical protein EVAR_100286_1 [Eumeta japonica]